MTSWPWPVVDTHCHVISGDESRYPMKPLGGKPSPWSRERPVDGTGLLAAMDRAGVRQAVVVQASTCYGHDNRLVQDTVQAEPQRLVGVYSADLLGEQAVTEIERWQSAGLAGTRFFIAGHTAADHATRLDDPRAEAVWTHLAATGIPVCVQIRADGLAQLVRVIERWPGLTVLLDHLARPELGGGPPYAESGALWDLASHRGLYFKYTTHNVRESAHGRSTPQAFCEAMVRCFGAERLAWGSNFPASDGSLTEQLAAAVQATEGLSAAQRRWIFSDTARRLYPGLGDGAGA